jgi:2-methylisocitrate lyase-like PEP mutase family enzyme
VKKFSDLMRGSELIVAPVALNPIMARLAEEAGFKALYLSGGSLGWLKCVTEANLTLPELAAVALDMRAVCQLPMNVWRRTKWTLSSVRAAPTRK